MKNNNRLVLGERDAVLQEARDHGGFYIDPHPDALAMLRAASIDPFMVYERGVVAQMEGKIPRIDVVQADVDQLAREWEGKPDDRTPIHIRLILWLKDNAVKYGYVQEGNSWMLK